MEQGFQICFGNFPASASAIFKDGGRQYKCHNIYMLKTLNSSVDSDIHQCTFDLH